MTEENIIHIIKTNPPEQAAAIILELIEIAKDEGYSQGAKDMELGLDKRG